MIRKLEGILRLVILCMGVYLVYTLYQPQADRLIREHQNSTLGKEEACLLTADDFEMIGLKKKPQNRQIGFCAGGTA